MTGAPRAEGREFLVVTGDFVRTGGMDVANHALADYLARQGALLHLVAHRVDPALAAYPNVRVHHVPKPAGAYLLGGPFLDAAGRMLARRVAARGGRVVVNGGNCLFGDANWVHYVHAAFRPESRAGLARAAKDAVTRARSLRREARALRAARTVITNSDVTKRHVVELLGVDPARVHTVYYGTDPARLGPASPDERRRAREAIGIHDDTPAVAFVGALSDRRKGFDTLFSAVGGLVARSSWPGRLVVIGTGAELPAWRARAAEAGLSDRVLFLGFRKDVPFLLAGCDALCAPTRYEAYGLGVHEALCRGIPALVSATAGVAERFPAELRDLAIVEHESPDAWAGALERWTRSRIEYAARVAPFAEELRRTTWDAMAERLLSVLDQPL